MAERTTVVYPNPQILAEAVAARTLLTSPIFCRNRIAPALTLP